MKTLVILTHCLCCLLALFTLSASALPVPEKLVYDVSWSGISAGTAVQEVTVQGDDLRIVNTIRSSGVVSALFSVDDKTESIIPGKSPAGLPRFFSENIKEGKRRSRKEARFDPTSLTVLAKDLLKKTEKSEPISKTTYDFLSSIYFIRSRELAPGDSLLFQIYDFKRLWNAEVRVVKREQIRTPLGKFKTLKVTSRLTLKGEAARAGNMTVWFTDDPRHIPVKIITQLKVGEITMTLTGGSYWR